NLAPEVAPSEPHWPSVQLTTVGVADAGAHEPSLASFGSDQRVNENGLRFPGKVERRTAIAIGTAIAGLDVRISEVEEKLDEAADCRLGVDLSFQTDRPKVADLENFYLRILRQARS